MDQIKAFFEAISEINTVGNLMYSVVAVVVAFVLGMIIFFTYKITCKKLAFDADDGIVLILVPIVVALLLSVIGTNIARAFSLAGALSIIRYRSKIMHPKSIAFIFFGMGAGFITGCGLYLPALVFVLITCLIIVMYTAFTMDKKGAGKKTIKIAVPENINYDGMFDDVMEKYTSYYSLDVIRLISGGTVTELTYNAMIKDGSKMKEFMDDIRVMNGNFKVQITQYAASND